jgi:hypothetical protein
MTHNILMQISLGDVDFSNVDEYRDIKLQFRCPATIVTNLFDPWESSCRVSETFALAIMR